MVSDVNIQFQILSSIPPNRIFQRSEASGKGSSALLCKGLRIAGEVSVSPTQRISSARFQTATPWSAIARAAAQGEPTLLTDYGKSIAMITPVAAGPSDEKDGVSDLSEFRRALLALPHDLDVDF